MSGAFQLLFHFALLGLTLGLGIAVFNDHRWTGLVVASVLWIGFWFHLADAAWIARWGVGRDWIDRIGILIRGSGMALLAFAILANTLPWTIILGLIGILALSLGRAVWEMIVLPRATNAGEE